MSSVYFDVKDTKYLSNFYYTPTSLKLSIQAPQNFVANSNVYRSYSVVIGNGVFVYSQAGTLLYSKTLKEIETHVYPTGEQT